MLATLVFLLAAATVAVPLTRRFGLGSMHKIAFTALAPYAPRMVASHPA